VRLVTPVFIPTHLGTSPVVSAFGFRTLHFVPEPGTALLVGAGIVGADRGNALGRARIVPIQ